MKRLWRAWVELWDQREPPTALALIRILVQFFVEVINLLNHENVLGYDVFRERDAGGVLRVVRNAETWFSILPSAGVSWSKRF